MFYLQDILIICDMPYLLYKLGLNTFILQIM